MTGQDGRLSFSEIIFDLNTDLYQELEDTFDCSGMCRPGLFFFDKKLEYGAPEQTCLHTFKHVLDNSARPYATSALLSGITGLIMFFCHFGLYFRPTPNENDDSKFEVGSERALPQVSIEIGSIRGTNR